MKKLFIAFSAMFFFVSVVSATNGLEKTLPVKKKSIVKIENVNLVKKTEAVKTFCSVSCSITYQGVKYSTSGGNWFSSCERATRRCSEKLHQIFGPSMEVVY
jgi:hypothetical protein